MLPVKPVQILKLVVLVIKAENYKKIIVVSVKSVIMQSHLNKIVSYVTIHVQLVINLPILLLL